MNEVTKLHEDLISEERIITLYEICKILGKRHNDAVKIVQELHNLEGFGSYEKIVTTIPRGNNGATQEIKTFFYTKKQALMVGARLDNKNIIKLVNKLEELSKPKTFEEIMRDALLLADKKVKELQNKIQQDKPKVEFAEAVAQGVNAVKIQEWVKAVASSEGIVIGRNKAFACLRNAGYLMKNNEPYQRYIDNGYFEVKETPVVTPKGIVNKFTTLITGKGQINLLHVLKECANTKIIK